MSEHLKKEVPTELRRSGPVAEQPNSGPVEPIGAEPTPRILVAEDNLICRMVTLRMLKQLGYAADFAENGLEVLTALAARPYDLVLMDVQMPKMNGFEATAAIREQELQSGRHLPVIAVTVNTFNGNRERCLEAGMDDCVPKPFRLPELDRAIKRHLRTGASPLAILCSTAARDVQHAVFNRSEAMQRLGGDAAHLGRLVAMFLRDAPGQLAQIEHDLAEGSSESAVRESHALKGAAAMLSAHALSVTAERLEVAVKGRDRSSVDTLLTALKREFEQLQRALGADASRPVIEPCAKP